MKAIVETGGKQYTVATGDCITVELLPEVAVESTVSFDQVLAVLNGQETMVGQPTVEGASVLGKVVAIGKTKKVHGVKFHRRRRYLKRLGHRQNMATVEIGEIKIPK